MTTIRIGTRASDLAVAQTSQFAAELREVTGVETEIVRISTEGDRNLGPLAQIGGQGVFVAALREALAAGTVDVAVHSLKDLPTTPDPRLVLAAIPLREDPRDAVVTRAGYSLGTLPQGSRVGTGSLRRQSQLNSLGMGLEVVAIRGNVDTRINKVRSGELDAVLLACAGLARLGRLAEASDVLDPVLMIPAPGQGALAAECRADDDTTIGLVQGLDDRDTRAAVTAERSLLATLEAGCTAPVGALAVVAPDANGEPELWLRAAVGDISGIPDIRLSATGSLDDPAAVGERLAVEMLAEGAAKLLAVDS